MLEGETAVYTLLILIITLLFITAYSFRCAIVNFHKKEIVEESLDSTGSNYPKLQYLLENIEGVKLLVSNIIVMLGVALAFCCFSIDIEIGEKGVFNALYLLLVVIVIKIIIKITEQKFARIERQDECFPKNINIISFLYFIFQYPIKLQLVIIDGLVKLFVREELTDNNEKLEGEISYVVNEGHKQGVIEANEAEMIHNILKYSNKDVQDIMINRTKIKALESQMLLNDAIEQMLLERKSRFPVYEESIDHIIGVLYLKDAMRFHDSDKELGAMLKDVEGLLRKAEYTPLTKAVSDLLQSLRSKRLQMAIVVDEYGQTAGIVTMEDILEEIVGEIQDEYDEMEAYIEEKTNDSYLMDGETPLEDIEEMLGITFEEIEFDILNGFMIGQMEHIPEENEKFKICYKGYEFEIKEIESRRVKTVLVTKCHEESDEIDSN